MKDTKSTRKDKELAMLVPDAMTIVESDGTKLVVAGNADENRILNWLMMAKMRSMLEATMKKIRDQDIILTTKELKEMAEAVSKLSDASEHTYANQVDGFKKAPTPANPSVKTVGSIDGAPADFETILKPIEAK